MVETVTVIHGGHGAFILAGVSAASDAGTDLQSTLIEWSDQGAGVEGELVVRTGSQFGPYEVTLWVGDAEPPVDSSWEDISEVSVLCDAEVGVGELIDGPQEWLQLAAGMRRLRVSARDRTDGAMNDRISSDDTDSDSRQPRERYRLELWPAAQAPARVRQENSEFARGILDPPAPAWPAERQPAVEAARRVAADLRGEPGCRLLDGELCDVSLELETRGTPTRTFNRMMLTTGWPFVSGGGANPNERVGDTAFHWAKAPEDDGLETEVGTIRTRVIEIDKPRVFALAWNWDLPDVSDRRGPKLLQTDSTVVMTVTKTIATGDLLIRVEHKGVPGQWGEDLVDLWRWDILDYLSR